jgi:dienelactone hydrolase
VSLKNLGQTANFRQKAPEIHVCPAGPARHLNLSFRLFAPLFVLAACAFAPSRAEERRQIRAALFVPDPLPALQLESYGQIEIAPGVTAERVSYATDYGLRVPAIVYRPTRRPAVKMPGLIVVNGHGGDKYSWYAFYAGILYARAGATVVTYDPIGEGERNAERKNGTRQHDREVEPAEMGRRMGGLMMTDVMQAVSYLAQRRDVDAKRLAAMGYSMGAFVLGLACATETRLHACVLVGGGNLDGEGGYWDASSKKMCQAIPYQAMKFLGDRGAALYDLHADRGVNGQDGCGVFRGAATEDFRAARQFEQCLRVRVYRGRRTPSVFPDAAGRAVAGEAVGLPQLDGGIDCRNGGDPYSGVGGEEWRVDG